MSKIRYAKALVTHKGNITKGKVYEVITHYELASVIEIMSDSGELRQYAIFRGVGRWFDDVSIQIRRKKINRILTESLT